MNMLNEEESFHATREGFNHLCDIERSEVELMSATVGKTDISAMSASLFREQHDAYFRCIQNELVTEREEIALLH